ncbi:MAG: hypothetical protein WC523_06190 [Patescibacteria group bacterium]|jgi:hypothetical protein
MKKANFFAGLFFNPKKVIANIQPRIQELEKEIKSIEAMDNKVEAIVRLFQIISPLQDAGGFSQEIFELRKHDNVKFGQQIEALSVLQKHFSNAGRSEYGINRTKKGEEVNAEKVYLGNVFGIWTKTAAYWLEKKEELKKTLRPDVSKNPGNPISNWYLINDYQCGGFVKSHTDGILEQIAILKAVA